MTTLVIAIHTFVVVAFRKDPTRMRIPAIVLTCIWLYVVIFVAILASHTGQYVWNYPTPYWCWVGHQHLASQLAGEYLWLWIAGLASIVLYVPLYFIVRSGYGGRRKPEVVIPAAEPPVPERPGCEECSRNRSHSHSKSVKEGAGQQALRQLEEARARREELMRGTSNAPGMLEPPVPVSNQNLTESPSLIPPPLPSLHSVAPSSHSPEKEDDSDVESTLPATFSFRILLYPIVYTVLVLPLSIARWSTGFGSAARSDPSDARTTFAAGAVFYLSGFANAFLLLYVRRSVSLLSPPLSEEEELEKGKVERRVTDDLEGGEKKKSRDDVHVSYTTTSGRPAQENRRKKSKHSIGESDLRMRTVEVKGDAGLPD